MTPEPPVPAIGPDLDARGRTLVNRGGIAVRRARARLAVVTLPELWAFLAVALPVLASLIAPLPTVDLAYQLRAGAGILGGGGIPSVDSWTFTAAGEPWLDQQWGAQAILQAVYAVTGWSGLAILRAALVGLIFGLLLAAIRRRNPAVDLRRAAWLTLAAFIVAAPALALRPQLLGMVAFAASLLLLADRRDHPERLWFLPAITLAWANVHGSFILAPVLVALAWLEDRAAHASTRPWLLLILAAVLLATLVNPFGLGAWTYAAGLAGGREVTGRISEWQPTTFRDVQGLVFWGSVAAVAVFLARRRATTPLSALAALGAFALLGAWAVRGIAWWPLVAAVVVAGLVIAPAEAPRVRRGSPLNGAVMVGLAVAGVLLLPIWRAVDPGTGAPAGILAQAPSAITARLRDLATPADRVWNPQAWGSWLEFAVPAPRYAVDSRIEIFPATTWQLTDLLDASTPRGTELLARFGVTIVVASGRDTPLERALAADSTWRATHRDRDGSIWIRTDR